MAGKRGDGFQKAPDALRKAIMSMKRKLDKNRVEFQKADLVYDAEMGDGRTIRRGNPLVQEYRAMAKDYASLLKAYKEITGGMETAEADPLDDLRSKFKVAK